MKPKSLLTVSHLLITVLSIGCTSIDDDLVVSGDTDGGGAAGDTARSRPQGDASTALDARSSPVGDAATQFDGGAPVVGNPRRVLLCDEGNGRLLLMDLQTPDQPIWSVQLDGLRDIQIVGGNRVAASIATGYAELDLATGEVKKKVARFSGVESMRRLPTGDTVLGANANGGVTLQELDAQDVPVAARSATFTKYSQLRLLRRTGKDSFLIGVGAMLAEVDWSGEILWEMNIPDGSSVYEGLRLTDGTIAVTSGYGAAVLIVDPATKKVLTTIGGKGQPEAATVVPNFFAGFQVLHNGHFVVTNWEGHGAGNGGRGIQLLEYDASGGLVWTWKQNPNLVSSLHNVIVLDGLDTTKLYDDIDGVLTAGAQ
jgi:hypothetical protein